MLSDEWTDAERERASKYGVCRRCRTPREARRTEFKGVSGFALVCPTCEVKPDWKPPRRVRDTAAMRRKVRRNPSCRSCSVRAREAHHVLLRSLGGDDVDENIVCLCSTCHTLFHMSVGDEQRQVAETIGRRLTDEEVAYVIVKLGDGRGRAFLQRYYQVSPWNDRYDTRSFMKAVDEQTDRRGVL
jgi:hypothetical protein